MRNFRTRPNTQGCDSKPSSSSKKGRCGGKQRMQQVRFAANPTRPTQYSTAYTLRRLPVAGLPQIRWSRQLDSRARNAPRARNDQDGRGRCPLPTFPCASDIAIGARFALGRYSAPKPNESVEKGGGTEETLARWVF